MPIYQHINSSSTQWTVVHDKAFQRAIVMLPENIPNRWEKMTHHVPGNWSPEDLKQRYEKLEHDVFMIKSCQVEFPELWNKVETAEVHRATQAVPVYRKKGVYGPIKTQGDWKGIATQFVVSRTSNQVASHAQKYFLCQNTSKRDRKITIQLLVWKITLFLHSIGFLLYTFAQISYMNCSEYRSNHRQKCYSLT
ncbi:hypothetical protein TanjilG_21018 [Lupinus angustifolius]|uniref:Myb-like domain-containing protein n=1 Tax=Lupinus angustifolius TaxID=3871 RepID=A0A1J7HAT7_LUPAN|nr:hypothetical protein TanjilG_21018 [Lupinus angustifolius]